MRFFIYNSSVFVNNPTMFNHAPVLGFIYCQFFTIPFINILNKPNNKNFNFRNNKKDLHKINNYISADEVRVILDDGEQLGVMKKSEAIDIAKGRGLDLVEIAPNNKPPVCKIVDYGKFKYQEQKKKNEAKKKQKVIETKELKIRPGTGEHDYQVKIKSAQKFLKEGNRVKFSLRFKGREMEHSNLGINMLQRVKNDLNEIIRVEMEPKIEGRQAFLVVAPKQIL